MLKVQLLAPTAKAPAVAHPGEDLGYDIFSLEAITLPPHSYAKVRTGIAVEARHPKSGEPLGLLVRDRSSIASKGVFATAGVIDAGYRGEILILLTNQSPDPFVITSGDKIAQLIPLPILTGEVSVTDSLEDSSRGEKGFGSSGR